ncbi:uncharacterized protein B0J16DRAFT_390356 [Fusarium flagelliforme]|uniref:Uncharacterized protein n=1 Tax=Fusarium flagelliforme TaxID=2675880 RepID=A0A395N1L9_9HYPO|nr:uncharacterized protein B0J16DRAFT_390356 [Fusarium flagelliforme]KAH7196435.1 hypothetical protein B0J16DRAFT_390356 [Fusarium flagelliforme]RFN53860.1 hypothetical protein FIE12Z_1894 [Fusarium flagelliforme]
MAGPQAYDWRELIARLALSGDRHTPSTLDHAPTRRVLHSNMLRLPNANGEHLESMHKISFKHFPEKRRQAKFVPFGIWRMMFFRRLAWVRMNETSPDILAALSLDLNGLPTTENMAPDVADNGTHIFDGRHDNFIDLFLPIDEIWNKLKTPTNQQWIQHAIQEDRIRFRNLEQLRTILRGTTEPRHIAFTRALNRLFPDGSPTATSDPFEFLRILMDLREQIVADLAVLQVLHKDGIDVGTFLNSPDDVVSRMERLAGPGIPSDSRCPSDSLMTDQQAQLPRFKPLRIVWTAACLKTRNPRHQISINGARLRQSARHHFNKFMEDQKANELTLAEMDLWI